MKLSIALFFATSLTVAAQAPQVPHKMEFAGMTLTIRDDARKEIQKDVDALTKSPRHFNMQAERAKTYFPIIEKVFDEEHVPNDFKYLVLQESSLIDDAVSVSNAVGFWQFKDYTAIEVGMRVDKEIDERMNIVSASRGAARYFKKNNTFFNNWLYALQAYQMGAGAVLKTESEREHGARNMEITGKTYWYVKKFLAHKIAFEDAVTGPAQVQVVTYENKTKKTLSDLAREISVDEVVLKSNNKWAKSGIIPDDRTYMVLIPVLGNINDFKLPAATGLGTVATSAALIIPASASIAKAPGKINGLLTITAVAGENPTSLAQRAAVELSDFLKWNDISISDAVKAGQVYFIARKRTRASEAYHKVLPGEDLWIISQNYGVQLKKLKKYNRLQDNLIKAGETLWLSAKRPKDIDATVASTKIVEVDKETFNWSPDSLATSVIVDTVRTFEATITQVVAPEVSQAVIIADSIKTDTLLSIPPASKVEADNVIQKDSIITVSVRKTEHTVQTGETLYAIAHLYNIGVMDLVNWNNLDIQAGIKPGQVLKLSENQSVTPDLVVVKEPIEIVHEVKASDTLYSVARKYGVTIKEIMEWNRKTDFNVTVGEKLKILR